MAASASSETPVLGRLGHNLAMGIVGLPNVGKSTFFNVLTKSSVPAENYPFCTVDPNNARVAVPDARFDWLVEMYKPASVVPAYLQVTDIAGLVRGAHEGKGLGNAFLSHIRAVDGIFQVVRVFDDEEIVHVEGSVDPIRDLEIIDEELRAKDVESVQARFDTLESSAHRGSDKAKKAELESVREVMSCLKANKNIRFKSDWKPHEIEVINEMQLLTAKPVIYLVNLSEKDFLRKRNPWLPKIKAWTDTHGGEMIIPFSASLETSFSFLASAEEKAKFSSEKSFQSALPRVILSGYKAIHLIHYFTAGSDEVKCWTIRTATRAPQAAGRIHSDFEKGFICAEVMKYDDLVAAGSEGVVKANGKYRQEGRGYVVEDGDIIFFRFNVSGGGGKKK